MIRFQSDDNPQADNAEIEVSQGASIIYAGSVTTGVSWHTLPNGSTGTLSIRARNIKAGVYSSYSAATSFTVEDYSAATQLYSKTYNTVSPGCGSSSGFPSAWSVFCNSDPAWGSLCTDAFGGGGNVWICDSGDYLGTNVSGAGLYSANSAIFNNTTAPDTSLTATGYLQNSSGTDDAMGFSCRDGSDGNNNHYALWLYPNRNPATSDNLAIVRHYSSNSITTITSGRFSALSGRGAGAGNAVTLRFDCLGNHLTAYFFTGGAYKPLLSASDSSLPFSATAAFPAVGVGPGGLTSLHTRLTSLTLKKYP